MPISNTVVRRRATDLVLSTHVVLRNTYFLLSLTLLFSAGTAAFAMISNAPPPNFIVLLVGMFGLSMLTTSLRNSAWGIAAIFAFTGFMGYTLGPMMNMYLVNFTNGAELIMTALGATGIIFLGLSAYALTTQKDFSYMGGMLFVASMVAFMAGIGAMLFQMPILQLFVSGAFALIASGMILFQTSLIITGGERNYIMATISLYVSLFNLFVSLMQILSVFGGRRD